MSFDRRDVRMNLARRLRGCATTAARALLYLSCGLVACGGVGSEGATGGAGSGQDAAGTAGSGTAAGTSFAAVLGGEQETPPVATAAQGMATFVLDEGKMSLSYHVTHGVKGGIAAHVHLGAGGEAGPILLPLEPFGSDMSGTISLAPSGGGGPSAQGLIDDLEKGLLYVNVHSSANPGGEIRGQILSPGATLFVATLTGAQETPPQKSAGSGHAMVILNSSLTAIQYHLETTLTPTNAHIHRGIGTIAGPVTFPLAPIAPMIDGTVTITDADAADLADGRFYVNVHTAAFPMGEIRGQLLRPGQVLYTAMMSPQNEVPPVMGSAATGGGQFILDADGTTLQYEVVLSGINPTLAHIHAGAAGVNGPVVYPLTLAPPGAIGKLTITAADVAALNGAGYYCNAHTAANPTGEIRGQLGKQ